MIWRVVLPGADRVAVAARGGRSEGGPRQDCAGREIKCPPPSGATRLHPSSTRSALSGSEPSPQRRNPRRPAGTRGDPPMSGAPLADRRRRAVVRAPRPLVGHLVREMLARVPAHINRDDLLSAGYAALVAAARGFDDERGVPFPRFAAARVRGALLDELRGLDWASRSVRQRARRTDSARPELPAQPAP